MKNTIGLIAPHEPEVLAVLTQQRITWQQARRHAIRRLLAGTVSAEIVADLQARFGLWPAMAGRLVRQAQSLLHPQSQARTRYLGYLAECDDAAVTADEAEFYRSLPGPSDDVLVGVDFRAPQLSTCGDSLSLVWLPKPGQFQLTSPLANPGQAPGCLTGVPVLFADEQAEELSRLTTGKGDVRPVKAPTLEMVWWQGQPHLVVSFDPDELAAYVAIRAPGRGTLVTAAVAATLTVQTALPVGAAYAQAPAPMVVAAVNTPVVKVMDSTTGRQLNGVRLVAEDGKVLARSDDSGTLVLPSGYARYNLFNLVKEGYQFMLLESAQLTPHNLLRVEMAPVTAKGKASVTLAKAPVTKPQAPKPQTQIAKVTTPPALPGQRMTAPHHMHSGQQAPSKLAHALTPAIKPVLPVTNAIQPKPAAPKAQAPAHKPQAPVHQQAPKTQAPKPVVHQQAPKANTQKPAAPQKAPALRRTAQAAATLTPPAKQPKLAPSMAELTSTPRTTTGGSYVVQKGDTLWTIAQRQLGNGSRWMSLYQANRQVLSSPTQIFPGQKLVLPTATTVKAAAQAQRYKVRVKPGDSLSKIALQRLGSTKRWEEIYALNRGTLRSPRLIFPGQVLWVPAR